MSFNFEKLLWERREEYEEQVGRWAMDKHLRPVPITQLTMEKAEQTIGKDPTLGFRGDNGADPVKFFENRFLKHRFLDVVRIKEISDFYRFGSNEYLEMASQRNYGPRETRRDLLDFVALLPVKYRPLAILKLKDRDINYETLANLLRLDKEETKRLTREFKEFLKQAKEAKN